MSSLSFLMALLCVVLGCFTFNVKQNVMKLERQLHASQGKVRHLQEAIHVLETEWSYLTNPTRLQPLAEKFLAFVPSNTQHILPIQLTDPKVMDKALVAKPHAMAPGEKPLPSYDTDAMGNLAKELGGNA